MSDDCTPTCQPTLPPVIVINSGGLHVPFWSRTTAIPLPRRPPTTNPTFTMLGTMTNPSALASIAWGIPAVGRFMNSLSTFVAESTVAASCA